MEGVERRANHALRLVLASDRMRQPCKALGRGTLRDGRLFSLMSANGSFVAPSSI